ncbi:MAG: 4Fe-4S binding protein [Proteobacteria bacterium]|nr:4Fe-4S binding protein [Pseudomonadota bacterium]
MVRHIVDMEKCRGCGKCVEACGLELWVLQEKEDGKKFAQVTEEAAEVCHLCGTCKEGCPEQAIVIIDEG